MSKNFKSKKSNIYSNHHKVKLSNHAYERLLQRYTGLTRQKMETRVQNMIQHGRLIGLKPNEEVYSNQGIVFCCVKVKGINGNTELLVKTVKLTTTRRRTHFSDDLSYEKIDNQKLGIKTA